MKGLKIMDNLGIFMFIIWIFLQYIKNIFTNERKKVNPWWNKVDKWPSTAPAWALRACTANDPYRQEFDDQDRRDKNVYWDVDYIRHKLASK